MERIRIEHVSDTANKRDVGERTAALERNEHERWKAVEKEVANDNEAPLLTVEEFEAVTDPFKQLALQLQETLGLEKKRAQAIVQYTHENAEVIRSTQQSVEVNEQSREAIRDLAGDTQMGAAAWRLMHQALIREKVPHAEQRAAAS